MRQPRMEEREKIRIKSGLPARSTLSCLFFGLSFPSIPVVQPKVGRRSRV